MSFAAPAWIGLAAVASLAVVAIHLIAWRLPRTTVLPTARFVPDEPARSAARTILLSDIVLLAVRVAVVMLGGVAMARPVFESRPSGVATVIAVAAASDSVALMDSLRAIRRTDHTSFVVFDTTARIVAGVPAIQSASRAFAVSTGVLAAIREARRLQQDYDTVRIALIGPFTPSAFDNATSQVRALWPDSIHMVRIPPAGSAPIPPRADVEAGGDDPVVAGIRLAQSNGLIQGKSRVIRAGTAPVPDSGETIVLWPRRSSDDAAHMDGVWAAGTTAIGSFIPSPLGDSGRVIARWANGVPAAREWSRGSGCIRAIGFDVPDVGDFVLSPAFQRLASELLAPCGGSVDAESVPDSLLAMLSAPPATPPIHGSSGHDLRNRAAAIIMVLATLLGVAELLVRRTASKPTVVEQRT